MPLTSNSVPKFPRSAQVAFVLEPEVLVVACLAAEIFVGEFKSRPGLVLSEDRH